MSLKFDPETNGYPNKKRKPDGGYGWIILLSISVNLIEKKI